MPKNFTYIKEDGSKVDIEAKDKKSADAKFKKKYYPNKKESKKKGED